MEVYAYLLFFVVGFFFCFAMTPKQILQIYIKSFMDRFNHNTMKEISIIKQEEPPKLEIKYSSELDLCPEIDLALEKLSKILPKSSVYFPNLERHHKLFQNSLKENFYDTRYYTELPLSIVTDNDEVKAYFTDDYADTPYAKSISFSPNGKILYLLDKTMVLNNTGKPIVNDNCVYMYCYIPLDMREST